MHFLIQIFIRRVKHLKSDIIETIALSKKLYCGIILFIGVVQLYLGQSSILCSWKVSYGFIGMINKQIPGVIIFILTCLNFTDDGDKENL